MSWLRLASLRFIEPLVYRKKPKRQTVKPLYLSFDSNIDDSACHATFLNSSGGDVAQLVERRTGTLPTQIRFPGAARDFSPRLNFQCRFSYGVRTPPCKIACIYICAHVKDPVVHVRVRWIMETLKHPGSVTLSQLAFPRESNPNFAWEKSHWDSTDVKSKKF